MNHPRQRTWAMKHPALAKAYAVALVVMCFVLLFGAAKGYTERAEENEDRLRYEQKFAERITNYIELSAELENSISYEEAWAELEKIIEQHEDDASQHKTDLAMYSAEKGGNTMGANMIWEVMPELKGAKMELEQAKLEVADAEAQLAEANAGFQQGGGATMAAAASQGAAVCAGYVGQLSALINAIDAEPEKPSELPPPEAAKPDQVVEEPVAPAAPSVPVEPAEPIEPTAPVLPENPTEEEKAKYESLKAQYDADMVAYAEKLALYPELKAKYDVLKAQYDADKAQYDIDKARYDEDYAAYQAYVEQLAAYEAYAAYMSKAQAYSAWMTNCMTLLAQTDLEALGAEAQLQAQALQELSGPAMALIESFSEMFGDEAAVASYAGARSGAGAGAGGMGGMGGMDTDQMLAAAYSGAVSLKAAFEEIESGYSGIAYGLDMISQGLAEGEAELEAGKAELADAEKQLKTAEHEAQKTLEDIWYNLGELEKERTELEKDKERLDEEASKLSKDIKEADELRELENDRTSAKLLLTSVKEVNDMFAENDDLVASAEKYLENYKAETVSLYNGRLIVCILAAIGGVAGLAGIPAVYDFARRRFWLIWPVVLCLIAATAAEMIYFNTVHEMWYVGLFVAIIAALHLVIVIPKEKKPEVSET